MQRAPQPKLAAATRALSKPGPGTRRTGSCGGCCAGRCSRVQPAAQRLAPSCPSGIGARHGSAQPAQRTAAAELGAQPGVAPAHHGGAPHTVRVGPARAWRTPTCVIEPAPARPHPCLWPQRGLQRAGGRPPPRRPRAGVLPHARLCVRAQARRRGAHAGLPAALPVAMRRRHRAGGPAGARRAGRGGARAAAWRWWAGGVAASPAPVAARRSSRTPSQNHRKTLNAPVAALRSSRTRGGAPRWAARPPWPSRPASRPGSWRVGRGAGGPAAAHGARVGGRLRLRAHARGPTRRRGGPGGAAGPFAAACLGGAGCGLAVGRVGARRVAAPQQRRGRVRGRGRGRRPTAIGACPRRAQWRAGWPAARPRGFVLHRWPGLLPGRLPVAHAHAPPRGRERGRGGAGRGGAGLSARRLGRWAWARGVTLRGCLRVWLRAQGPQADGVVWALASLHHLVGYHVRAAKAMMHGRMRRRVGLMAQQLAAVRAASAMAAAVPSQPFGPWQATQGEVAACTPT